MSRLKCQVFTQQLAGGLHAHSHSVCNADAGPQDHVREGNARLGRQMHRETPPPVAGSKSNRRASQTTGMEAIEHVPVAQRVARTACRQVTSSPLGAGNVIETQKDIR